MDLKELEILGEQVESHWYYQAKAAALLRLIGDLSPRQVLDVGAGSGFFSRQVLARTGATSATCVDPGYPADSDTIAHGKPLLFRRGVEHDPADLVLLMDVLEHVDDDVGLLRMYADPAPAGARFVITVPAFQWLWSGHDIFLEHRRRYTLAQIEGVARAAGLEVERGAYYFGAVFPLAVAARMAGRLLSGGKMEAKSQMRMHGALANSVLLGACRAELPVFPANRLAGLSAFVRARKAAT